MHTGGNLRATLDWILAYATGSTTSSIGTAPSFPPLEASGASSLLPTAGRQTVRGTRWSTQRGSC